MLGLDLHNTHERFGSSSHTSINGHFHYPNDVDMSLNETDSDKIRKYRDDYNNNPPNDNSTENNGLLTQQTPIPMGCALSHMRNTYIHML